jgi:branched-chain amino acid transport system permease protein
MAPADRVRASAALRVVGAAFAFLVVLRVALRHHPPPAGELAFGAVIGLLYALVAFGLILIYRANRVINFAQAEIGTAPALLGILLIKLHHVPYLVALAIALASGLVLGFVVEVVVVRRFSRAPRLVLMVATIGVALLLAVLEFYMPDWVGEATRSRIDPRPPKTPFSGLHVTINPIRFDANSLVIVIAAALVVLGLTLWFRLTNIGVAVRASSENADRATLLGIPVRRLSTIVWMLAAALSTLGVFLRIPVVGIPIGFDLGPYVLLYALAAAVLARMESFSVALLAGVAIGVLEQSLYYFSRNPTIASALMLPILLAALLAQRRQLSRAEDTGVATWRQASEFRPVPPELRDLPEVAWGRVGVGALVAVALVVLPYVVDLEQQILASVVVISAIVVVSLVILTGWAGQISLGQWGLAGVGSLVAGGLAAHLHADFFLTLGAAGLSGAAVSLIIGLPALRIQGLYLAVTTIAFAVAVQEYLLSPSYFGRLLPSPLQRVERPLLYGHYRIDGPRAFYFLSLAVLVLALLSAAALRRSRTGRVMIAARDNARGVQSYGVSVARARITAFAISGFWAALAGGLFAYHQRGVDAASFDPSTSLVLLIIVIIGGATSLPGAMLGATYLGILKYGGLNPRLQTLASAAGVLLLLWILPGGLAQLFYGIRDGALRWVARRRDLVVPSLVADSAPSTAETMVEARPGTPPRRIAGGRVEAGEELPGPVRAGVGRE